jgi:hypothetical protein
MPPAEDGGRAGKRRSLVYVPPAVVRSVAEVSWRFDDPIIELQSVLL